MATRRRVASTFRSCDLARAHGASVDVLVVLVAMLVVALVRARAPRRVLNAASATIVAMIAQGILGYVQYARAIPALLVGFHVFGAAIVFVCVMELLLELRVALTRWVPTAAGRIADRPAEARGDVAGVDASASATDSGHRVELADDGAARVDAELRP